uniref:Ovule protein n=1 Tax=Brugia timori TaxID=42155 RepID=A0A0R3QF83_9BILA
LIDFVLDFNDFELEILSVKLCSSLCDCLLIVVAEFECFDCSVKHLELSSRLSEIFSELIDFLKITLQSKRNHSKIQLIKFDCFFILQF